MTQRLAVEPGQKVLEIGTGSGYQTAVLSRLARTVYSLERIDELARAAAAILRDLEYQNVSVKAFDGTYGYPAAAPYDRILDHGRQRTRFPRPSWSSWPSADASSRRSDPPETAAHPRGPPPQDGLRAGGRRGGRVRAAPRPLRQGAGMIGAAGGRLGTRAGSRVPLLRGASRAEGAGSAAGCATWPTARVETVAEGSEDAVDRYLAGSGEGPHGSRVTAVDGRGRALRQGFSSFEITRMTDFRGYVRDVPDFPTPGILFRDVTPLLASPEAFSAAALEAMAEPFRDEPARQDPGHRGARVHVRRGRSPASSSVGFVPARKPGKLPRRTEQRRLRARVRQGQPRGARRRVRPGGARPHRRTTCWPRAGRRPPPRPSSSKTRARG